MSRLPLNSLTVPDVRAVVVYVYGLVDPRDLRLRYVGRSSKPRARLASHMSDSAAREVGEWTRFLRSIGLEPLQWILRVVEPGQDSAAAELDAIREALRGSADLLNCALGPTDAAPQTDDVSHRSRSPGMNRGAEALRAALRKHGSQSRLAKQIGVGQDVVSRWLSGSRRPDPVCRATIETLAGIDWRLWDEPVAKSTVAA